MSILSSGMHILNYVVIERKFVAGHL